MDSTLVSRAVSSRRSRPTEARSGEEMHRRDKDQHNYSKSAATHRSDVTHGLTRSRRSSSIFTPESRLGMFKASIKISDIPFCGGSFARGLNPSGGVDVGMRIHAYSQNDRGL